MGSSGYVKKKQKKNNMMAKTNVNSSKGTDGLIQYKYNI